MEIANASLLDESTAAAEAMIMMFNARSRAAVKAGANKFFVDDDIFLQTLDVLETHLLLLVLNLFQENSTRLVLMNLFLEPIFNILLQAE